MLFAILCICFIFYLFIGIYSYNRDKKSKINVIFFILSISTSLWAIGYAFILISPNMQIANMWRIVANLGSMFFSGIWLSFAFSFKNSNQKNSDLKIQALVYIILIIFFINILISEPSKVISSQPYGFINNLYFTTTIGFIFSIYISVICTAGLVIIYSEMKSSPKNRIKKQLKAILITSIITFCLAIADIIFPKMGVMVFPPAIIIISIGMCGMWYAINKHKMMSISYEIVSVYIFEAVNEPIFILGEDYLVKNCNEATLNITGYNYRDLEQNPLHQIINFRGFDFNTIMQEGNIVNIEVDLLRKNKEDLICELSATVIYDEYKDILGIIILLHDVSERKNIAEIQRKNTLRLVRTNFKLESEITDRLLAEEQIRHFIYYDALTEIYNRKKMLEDVETLLDDKNEKFAILFIDLDKFKSANDNYGHEAGDNILKAVAVRLKNIIRSTDEVYRIGGDEFIIILRSLKVSSDAEKIAVAALETLSTVFTHKENKLFIGASIGISIFPEHGIDGDTLGTKSDSAMYEVKRNGGNGYKIYSSEIKQEDSDNLSIK